MVDDSPCTGTCRIKGTRCISCYRTYDDIAQWLYLTKEARLERMQQLEIEKQNKK